MGLSVQKKKACKKLLLLRDWGRR